MPNRFFSLAILVAWAGMALALIRRDVLPDLLIGPPPDLRSVVQAGKEHSELTRWSIQVADDTVGLNHRSVGQVETQSRYARDGWCRMVSQTWFDSGAMPRGTALAGVEKERVEIRAISDIDPAGNLDSFRVVVHLGSDAQDAMTITGMVRDNGLRINAQGPLPILNWTRTYPYQPRQMVQHELGPLDWMPNLQVGQRLEKPDRQSAHRPGRGGPALGRGETGHHLGQQSGDDTGGRHPRSALDGAHVGPPRWSRLAPGSAFSAGTVDAGTSSTAVHRTQCQGIDSMIELRGVTKLFGTKRAVDQLDLTVRGGELFAFLGPNGAGKTTTIKMVCGLLVPTSGAVRVGGHPASSQAARQLLAYVPDQPYLYDKLTGREFLRFVVEMYGLDRRVAVRRIGELIETFEMARLRRRSVRELLAGDEAARRLRRGPGARAAGADRRRAAGGARPAQRPDRQGPVRLPGRVPAWRC